ncbi:hypothetical protein V6N11_065726 [Hibiscus sabdariffa]|uniref:Uncharacterized protein n=1 Tax=Hibiscus sabdariffa TaxID=183260 RepID=A0ABR2PIK1_9ROSI
MLIIAPRKQRGHFGGWPVTEVRPRVERRVSGVTRAIDTTPDGGEARGSEWETSNGVGKGGKRAAGEAERRDGGRVGDGFRGKEAFRDVKGESKVAREGGSGGAYQVPALKPPPCHQANVKDYKKTSTLELVVFLDELYIISVATGGTKSNISTIGAYQFDDFHLKEKAQKLSFFNW